MRYRDIISEGNFVPVTVYHGGRSAPTYYPYFVSPDNDVAQSYADNRSDEGMVFTYHPSKVAKSSDVYEVAEEFGFDSELPTYALISPNVDQDAQIIVDALIANGYDSVEFVGLAMDSDFREVPAIVILKPGVIIPLP